MLGKPIDKFSTQKVCPKCGCTTYYDHRPYVAWCWRTGLIEMGEVAPADKPDGSGAIVIARGPKAELVSAITTLARQSYTPHQWLVPGVPEAADDDAAADALETWLDWCSKSKSYAKRGVVFEGAT